ncbi:MAG: molybdopterin-binding protein, partial [Fervidicoccaceae archaeon]
IPDEPKLVEGAIEESLLEADLVLAVGGVSVSREDVVPSVVREMGEIVFHGVAVSPGKVSGFAVIRDKPLFMVPAHVGSTMACLLLFVAPAISSALTGNDDPYVVVSARLTRDARGRADRAALKFFALEREGSEINARPVEGPLGGSPLITMLTKSSGFAVIGPGEAKRAGELIEARLLPYTLMYA